MTESFNKNEVSAVNSSLSEKDFSLFSQMVNLTDSWAMKNTISNDSSLKKIVKTHFKEANTRALSTYSRYWVNMTSLQQSLVNYWFDLWRFWVQQNWVDWDFWTNTFVAIIGIQKSLWLKPTGVIDLSLMKYLFPRTFRTMNKKEGRSERQVKDYVKERISGYNEWLWEEKYIVLNQTKKRINTLKLDRTIEPRLKKKKISNSGNYDTWVNERGVKVIKRREVYKSASFLAKFLAKEWYPKYRGWKNCWANVWEALIKFWIDWLPTWWRDWYKWTSFLDNNPNFVKQKISNPKDALPWGVLVYDKWPWKTKARKENWHVEIVTNDGFWFWWRNRINPGWSTTQWFTWYVYYPKNSYS